MKKIVFFILLFMVVPRTINASPIIRECGTGEIEIDYQSTKGIIVVKRGTEPFLVHLEDDNASYYINEVNCENGNYVIYGYAHFHSADTYYDPLIIVLNDKGEQIHLISNDLGELEEVVEVLWFDNVYGVITEQISYEDDPQFLNSYVTLYDNNFNILEEYIFMEDFTESIIHESMLIINYNYDDEYDIGIKSNGEEVFTEQIFEFDSDYYGELYIPYINAAYINNEEQVNGITLVYPGIYDFSYNNQMYTFNIHPIVVGVTDKEVYDIPISINVSGGNVFLNGELYMNNTIIYKPGNYKLEIIGTNDYIKEIEFTIKAEIDGVINGHTYQDDLLINFNGEGYLNSNQVMSPLIIDKEGDYILRIIGDNGYSEEYNFSLNKTKSFDIVDFIQKIDIFIVVGVILAGVVIIKKSK